MTKRMDSIIIIKKLISVLFDLIWMSCKMSNCKLIQIGWLREKNNQFRSKNSVFTSFWKSVVFFWDLSSSAQSLNLDI